MKSSNKFISPVDEDGFFGSYLGGSSSGSTFYLTGGLLFFYVGYCTGSSSTPKKLSKSPSSCWLKN